MRKSKIILFLLLITLFNTIPLHAQNTVEIITNDYIPFTSSENTGTGVILDIIRISFAINNIQVKYIFAPWRRCEENLRNGSVFGSVPYFKTDERIEKYDFSDPVIYSVNRFYYNKKRFPEGFKWKTLSDLKGYRIGVIMGYWYEKEFETAGLNIDYVATDKQNIKKLIYDRIDFLVLDEITFIYIMKKYFHDKMEMIGMVENPLSILPFHIMISRKYTKSKVFTEIFNNGLETIKRNGDYEKILKKYGTPQNQSVH